MAKVFLPKGMRDLLPAQMNQRLRVIETVRGVFSRYGFAPLETPAMERIETLTGKYGDEGDKLIFRVLKRGEGGKRGEVDQALRYDLTVPLARVMAMNPGIPLPFKRSQIQPVWRADRPQKGRFREFYQCDVDVVGTTSRMAEAECLAVVSDSLSALGFDGFTIRLNDRRLLAAMAAAVGAPDQELSMIMSIDKLDKIGRDGVSRDLLGRGFSQAQIAQVFGMLDGGPIPGSEIAEIEAGLDEIMDLATALGVPAGRIQKDRTLARGLDYYTGPVFETVVTEPNIGSLSGGGRYDELIGMFSGKPLPAVGVSLGLERIFVVMEELGMLDDLQTGSRVFVTVFAPEQQAASLAAARAFRQAGIDTEVWLDGGKLKRQMKAAHRSGVPHVVVIGPDEAALGKVLLRDLRSGAQETLPLDAAVLRLSTPAGPS